jgi:hypothetical protein
MTGIYVVVIIPAACIAYWLIAQSIPSLPEPNGILDPPGKALNLVTDMVKLVLTICTGLVGVTIWLLTRPLTDAVEFIERTALGLAALILICASMYFGFVTMDGCLELLKWKTFDSRNNLVWWPQTLQYYSMLCGVFLLSLACLRSFNAILEKRER